jgi:phosphate starvation-inducible protein PhoH and related proteins
MPRKPVRKSRPTNTSVGHSLELRNIVPLTDNQRDTFLEYSKNKNLVLHGMAGTGKTFCALYLALKDVLNPKSKHRKVYIIRSAVPTRDVGFLPGSLKEKIKQYENPYRSICSRMFNRGDAYDVLKGKDLVEFMSTSFVRGDTYDNCTLIIDEMQNLSFHELDSVITRAGENTRIIFSGDFRQSDLLNSRDRKGLQDFLKILANMNSFSQVEFGVQDVVRSGLVKEYLINKYKLFS